MNAALERVVEALGSRGCNPRRAGEGWSAKCPAHDDRHPSLSIREGQGGAVLVKCHAGCSTEEVLAAMGLGMGDLFPEEPRQAAARTPGRVVEQYRYEDEDGGLLFLVERLEPKGFRQKRPDGNGGWIHNVQGVPRVPYRLPGLLAAVDEGQLVFVSEGEKDADRLVREGLVATCNACGAGKWSADHAAYLRGARVAILPDNDESGRRHAQQVARSLAGVAASVKVVALPGLPEKGDVSDWLAQGHTADELRALVEAAPEYSPGDDVAAEEWPEPLPLPDPLPPVTPFHDGLLPGFLLGRVRDIAARMQCPPDYPAAALVVALGSVLGRKVCIRPHETDDWTVVPNLWGVVIGRPGHQKSPAVDQVLLDLNRLEAQAREEHQRRMEAFRCDEVAAAEQERAIRQKLRRKYQKSDAPSGLADDERAQLAEVMGVEAPRAKRYLTNDFTVEKLAELLRDNANGILVFRDELAGLLRMMEREGHQGDRAFLLEAWSGVGRHTADRIGRGTIHIESAIVSILGTIQPGALQPYLRAAAKGGAGDDGLVQRFQIAVWPDLARDWHLCTASPDEGARARVRDAYHLLDNLSAEEVGAEQDEPDSLPYLRFDARAQAAFDQWRGHLERRLRDGTLPPALEGHLAKYRSLVPSLALIFHLAGGGRGPVPPESLDYALAWAEYLESHARRIYSVVMEPAPVPAHALAVRLLDGAFPEGFTLRTLVRKHWTDLADYQDARLAVDLLVESRWLREETVETGGRPSKTFLVSPRIHEKSGRRSVKSDESHPAPPSGTFVTPSPGQPESNPEPPDQAATEEEEEW